MRVNENIAVSTPKVLLVPYDAHHVERYHEWMQNDDLRAATASDLLSLEEEYENQQSWRTAHDKLTFIVCQSVTDTVANIDTAPSSSASMIYAGDDERMVGDVNLFLTPCDDEEEEEKNITPIPGEKRADEDGGEEEETCGEIDIMIATPEQRRKGLGEAAVRAFLQFLTRHRDDIMSEYSHARTQRTGDGTRARNARLKRLVAKINADNAGSIRLFENLGFRRDGEPNYFDEVSLVLSFGDLPATANSGTESEGRGYREVVYDRSRLKGVEK